MGEALLFNEPIKLLVNYALYSHRLLIIQGYSLICFYIHKTSACVEPISLDELTNEHVFQIPLVSLILKVRYT